MGLNREGWRDGGEGARGREGARARHLAAASLASAAFLASSFDRGILRLPGRAAVEAAQRHRAAAAAGHLPDRTR